MQLKRDYCSEQEFLVINNEFQNLNKGKMSITEYVVKFTEKMKVVPHLVPTELSKVEIFSNGLSADFGLMVKIEKNSEGNYLVS